MTSAATIAACTALVEAVTTGGAALEGAQGGGEADAALPSLAIIAARDGTVFGLYRSPQSLATKAGLPSVGGAAGGASTMSGDVAALSLAMGPRPHSECTVCRGVVTSATRAACGLNPTLPPTEADAGPSAAGTSTGVSRLRPVAYYDMSPGPPPSRDTGHTTERVRDEACPISEILFRAQTAAGSDVDRPEQCKPALVARFLQRVAEVEPGLVRCIAQAVICGCTAAGCPLREGAPPPDPQWSPKWTEQGVATVLTRIQFERPPRVGGRWMFVRGAPGRSMYAVGAGKGCSYHDAGTMAVEQTDTAIVIVVMAGDRFTGTTALRIAKQLCDRLPVSLR